MRAERPGALFLLNSNSRVLAKLVTVVTAIHKEELLD